jgi:1-acyl-sn-glycerol-3-phosphate acyltransferase
MYRLRAWFIADPLIVVATILFASVSIFISLFDRTGRRQAAIARAWSKVLLLASGVKVRVQGRDKIAPDGSYIFASSHASYMDTPVILANIPVQFRFLAKKGLFSVPFLGWHLARAGHVPVYRDNPRAAVKTLGLAADNVQKRGISLLVFPEGGRTPTGELQEFKDGAAYMAIRAGVPIVPVALIGTRAVLPLGSGTPRSGMVEMRIGDPIPTAGLKLHDRARLTQQVRDHIVSLLQEEPIHA